MTELIKSVGCMLRRILVRAKVVAQNLKKTWFCKQYQTGTCHFPKDHESNCRLQRHICAYRLSQCMQLAHAEKDCLSKGKWQCFNCISFFDHRNIVFTLELDACLTGMGHSRLPPLRLGFDPRTGSSGKAGSCLPLVSSLQYTTLANSMYWFPLPFQLPVVI